MHNEVFGQTLNLSRTCCLRNVQSVFASTALIHLSVLYCSCPRIGRSTSPRDVREHSGALRHYFHWCPRFWSSVALPHDWAGPVARNSPLLYRCVQETGGGVENDFEVWSIIKEDLTLQGCVLQLWRISDSGSYEPKWRSVGNFVPSRDAATWTPTDDPD
jgi:hypothetical protein